MAPFFCAIMIMANYSNLPSYEPGRWAFSNRQPVGPYNNVNNIMNNVNNAIKRRNLREARNLWNKAALIASHRNNEEGRRSRKTISNLKKFIADESHRRLKVALQKIQNGRPYENAQTNILPQRMRNFLQKTKRKYDVKYVVHTRLHKR